MDLSFLSSRNTGIHKQGCLCAGAVHVLPRKRYENLLSMGCQLARCWAEQLASWYLKAFAEPYQVVFISWSRRDEPGESVCPADAAASPRPVQTLSRSGSSVASIDRQPVLAAQPWLLQLRLLSLNHIVFIWSSLLHSLQSGTNKVK